MTCSLSLPPTYEQTASSSSDTLTGPSNTTTPNAVRMRSTAAAAATTTASSSDRVRSNNVAASPARPPVFKHRTKAAYSQAVANFKGSLEPVYATLIWSVLFSLMNLARFNERQGWAVYLAVAQLGAVPLLCLFMYLSFRAVTRNQGGDEIVIGMMHALVLLGLNLQVALVYVDLSDVPMNKQNSMEGFEMVMGVCSGMGAVIAWVWTCSQVGVWFHYTLWKGTEAGVYGVLPD
ncbi:hypothetical protein HK104_004525 [Borealophlyctis nickersoniae]|nr:hypothetical protein HK104_004525 [Borealophlyctis nickersoniae]